MLWRLAALETSTRCYGGNHLDTRSSRQYTMIELLKRVINGRQVVLLGNYGTGKSRCIQEMFHETATDCPVYPVAIDLRENWGLKRGPEIIRRHFDDLGLSSLRGRCDFYGLSLRFQELLPALSVTTASSRSSATDSFRTPNGSTNGLPLRPSHSTHRYAITRPARYFTPLRLLACLCGTQTGPPDSDFGSPYIKPSRPSPTTNEISRVTRCSFPRMPSRRPRRVHLLSVSVISTDGGGLPHLTTGSALSF